MFAFIKKLVSPAYSHEQLLAQVPVNRAIPIMSVPVMLGVTMVLFTTLAGNYYIGLLDSSIALVAYGVVYPLTLLAATVAMVLGAGLAASVGRCLGAKKYDESSRMASTMFAVCILAALLFSASGMLFLKPLFLMLGATEEVFEYARGYYTIQLISIFFTICSNFLNLIAAAESNMKLGAAAFIASSLFHVIVTPVMLFVLKLGLMGAAVASLTAQLVSCCILLLPYIRKKMLLKLSVRHVVPKPGIIGEVIRSGLPLGITQILTAFAIAFTNITAARVLHSESVQFIAGYGMAVRIVVMVQYLLVTYMIGFQAVAAYAYGAKTKPRFDAACRHANRVVLCADIAVAALCTMLAQPLMRLFSGDTAIVKYGANMIVSMCISLAISFPLPVIITSMQATGKGGLGAFVSALRQGVCYIPLVLLLPRLCSVQGFYLVQPLSDILAVALALTVHGKFKKQLALEFKSSEHS